RGPARRPAASHAVKKLELAAAPEVGSAAVALSAPPSAAPAPATTPGPAPVPVTKAPEKSSQAAPDDAPVAQSPARHPAGAKPQAAGGRHATAPVAPQVAVKLGPKYLDDVNGYSIHFPMGWRSKSRDGSRWVVDATDDAG